MPKTLAPSQAVTTRDSKGLKFVSVVEAAYNKAGLSEDEAQRVNDAPGLPDAVRCFIDAHRDSEAPILRLISAGETLVLDETDGAETIPASEGVFVHIDGNFKGWNADEASGPTPKTPVAVHELARDATFAQMFGSGSTDPSSLCLTQSQILNFIKKHRNWLRTDGYATFFLFRSRGELFVAYVYFLDRGRLNAYVYRFASVYVWLAGYGHRLVLPQL